MVLEKYDAIITGAGPAGIIRKIPKRFPIKLFRGVIESKVQGEDEPITFI